MNVFANILIYGMAGYKNYAMHFRGFLIGTVFSAAAGLVIAGIITLL